ncbi:hypothetical protein D3C81_1851960 [compost metagenome]
MRLQRFRNNADQSQLLRKLAGKTQGRQHVGQAKLVRRDFIGKQRRDLFIPQDHHGSRRAFSRHNGVSNDQMISVRHIAEQLHPCCTAIQNVNEIRQDVPLL